MQKKNKKHFIGIGITEHNRPDVLRECLANLKKYMPKDAKLVIVDDASTIPLPEATYRFEKNVGVARAKNKCFELLQDCEHIFLFDSDCWPKDKDWWKPYVEGREPHYSYIFQHFINQRLNDCEVLYECSDYTAYSHPRGCMLYFDSVCMDAIGGMDTNYKRWGYEHVDISNRIYNVGLTAWRYMDVPNSNQLIHSQDEHQAVNSTVSMQERRPYLEEMKGHFLRSFASTAYCGFVEWQPNEPVGTKDIVLGCYFTSKMDTQRNIMWTPNLDDVRKLAESMNGQKLVILHDCFDDDVYINDETEFVRVETNINPYFQRWFSEWEYLREHPEVRKVFHVDTTDVLLLRNPFDSMEEGKIYVGSEETVLYNNWIVTHHKVPFLLNYFKQHPRLRLLNCGLVGGDRQDVMDFMRKMNQVYHDEAGRVGDFEMGLFNYVCRMHFNEKLITGEKVHTQFKTFRDNGVAWWQHK